MPRSTRCIAFGTRGHRVDPLPFGGEFRRKSIRPGIVIEQVVRGARAAITSRFQHHGLVPLIFIETEMPPAMSNAVFVFLPAEDEPTVFRSFFVVEEHSCRIAIGARIFLPHIEG